MSEQRRTRAAVSTPDARDAAHGGASIQAHGPGWLVALQRTAIRTLLPIGMICFAASLPFSMVGDGHDRYLELQALLAYGTLTPGRYSLVGPLFATPLYLLGAAIGLPEAGVVCSNLVIFLLGLLALRTLLRPWLDERTLRVFLLLLLFGSMFPASAATFYGEIFTAIFVAVGLAATVVAPRLGRITGWLAVILGVANTPATLVGLGLALLVRMWQTRRWRYIVVGMGAVALILGESLVRRGSIFATGYASDHGPTSLMPFSGRPGFSYPLLFGLLGILLSFGKGLIFYTPGLFLPIWRRLAALGAAGKPLATIYTLWMVFVAGLVVLYAKWWGWNGDWFWGPRFFLIACIPASLALALWTQHPSERLWVNALALGTLALSLWVGIDSAVFSVSNLAVCQTNNYQFIVLCQFTPEYSPLLRPLSALYQQGFTRHYLAEELAGPNTPIFAFFAPIAGLYIAFPLLRTMWRQARALVLSRAGEWRASLRLGWRW